jgi:single-strand DNA-binding protein
MLNKIQIMGRLGADPDVRYSQSGSALTTISVATSDTWKDKEGNKQERTEWHRVKFFGKLAEIAGEYLKKGRLIHVEGSIRTEKYTDKEGIERYSTDIIAKEMTMIPGGGDSSSEEGSPQRSASGARSAGNGSGGGSRPPVAGPGARSGKPPAPMSNDPYPDDDIPFD